MEPVPSLGLQADTLSTYNSSLMMFLFHRASQVQVSSEPSLSYTAISSDWSSIMNWVGSTQGFYPLKDVLPFPGSL